MQFIDLKKQYLQIREDLAPRLDDILTNARFIMGKEVSELEEKLAQYVGVKYCIACASGTDALLIPLMAWGIGAGDAVFVPSFTFYASAEVIALTGATPVFIDVNEQTFCMDPAKLEEAIENVCREGKLTPKAVIPVDLFGQPAEHDKIKEIADTFHLLILEDAAQGFGGKIAERRAGSFGDVAATSFFPAKPLGCYGDGGAIFTDNEDYCNEIKSIRVHGQGSDKYDNVRLGLNGRMDTIQAAVLLSKLKIFDKELDCRNEIAEKYCRALDGIVEVPLVNQGYGSSWAQFTCKAEDESQRSAIIAALQEAGVPTAIYYPIPLHQQTVFRRTKSDYCDLSVSEALSKRVFSIPMHPYLTDEEIELITGTIRKALQR